MHTICCDKCGKKFNYNTAELIKSIYSEDFSIGRKYARYYIMLAEKLFLCYNCHKTYNIILKNINDEFKTKEENLINKFRSKNT